MTDNLDVMKIHVMYVDRPVVKITTATGGCRHVNISWSTTDNTDDCTVVCYNVTLSYVTMDDHVTQSMTTTMNSSTITGLPDGTHVNITVTAIIIKQVVFTADSTSVSTVAFESMYIHIILFLYLHTI